MVTNTQFFVLGIASNNLQMYKLTFLSNTVDWANKIGCSGTWSSNRSESLLSVDGSTIYLFFIYGSGSTFLYFAGLSSIDGSIKTMRYRSSISASVVQGSVLNGNYIVATIENPVSLMIYNIPSSAFIIKSFSGTMLFRWGVEKSSSR